MSRRPQIVLTDLVMPSLSGIEVLERIMEFDSSLEVVLITAHYSERIRRRSDQEGGQPLLDPPISLAVLIRRPSGHTTLRGTHGSLFLSSRPLGLPACIWILPRAISPLLM
jgi:CheY-like chemotaxis protein